jgi:hypothetical protein
MLTVFIPSLLMKNLTAQARFTQKENAASKTD